MPIKSKNFTASIAVVISVLITTQAFAQSGTYIGGYKQVKRLGDTNQSICRPGIRSAAEV